MSSIIGRAWLIATMPHASGSVSRPGPVLQIENSSAVGSKAGAAREAQAVREARAVQGAPAVRAVQEAQAKGSLTERREHGLAAVRAECSARLPAPMPGHRR